MEPEDSLKCLHEGRTVLHYNICVGADSKNTHFLNLHNQCISMNNAQIVNYEM